jgi:hypothetical protein
MPRTDFLEPSATRVELDQRSREARLRLERAERLLAMRPLPRQSLLVRVLQRVVLRIYIGEQAEGRSAKAVPTGSRTSHDRETSSETGGVAGFPRAAPPVSWPNCAARGRMGSVRSDPEMPARGPTLQCGLDRWG